MYFDLDPAQYDPSPLSHMERQSLPQSPCGSQMMSPSSEHKAHRFGTDQLILAGSQSRSLQKYNLVQARRIRQFKLRAIKFKLGLGLYLTGY